MIPPFLHSASTYDSSISSQNLWWLFFYVIRYKFLDNPNISCISFSFSVPHLIHNLPDSMTDKFFKVHFILIILHNSLNAYQRPLDEDVSHVHEIVNLMLQELNLLNYCILHRLLSGIHRTNLHWICYLRTYRTYKHANMHINFPFIIPFLRT